MPEISIRTGNTPLKLQNLTGRGVVYQVSVDQFLLTLEGIASYLVQNGNEIVVQPAPDSLASDVRIFLLGSCLGALLHQRGVLVLHASAVHTAWGAVLFTGASGMGKSTLLGEMLRRDYTMLADDVSGVVLDTAGKPVVQPAFPRTRLWADSAQLLEHDVAAMSRTRPSLEKYDRQLVSQFWNNPTPLRRIYWLTAHNRDEIVLERLPRLRTFDAVLQNTYRHKFLDGLAMRGIHFGLASAVAMHVAVTRAIRPDHPIRLRELADLIEQDIRHD